MKRFNTLEKKPNSRQENSNLKQEQENKRNLETKSV